MKTLIYKSVKTLYTRWQLKIEINLVKPDQTKYNIVDHLQLVFFYKR